MRSPCGSGYTRLSGGRVLLGSRPRKRSASDCLARLGTETHRSQGSFAREARAFKDLFDGFACPEALKNLFNGNPSALDNGLTIITFGTATTLCATTEDTSLTTSSLLPLLQ